MFRRFFKSFVVFAAIGAMCMTSYASSDVGLQGRRDETKKKKEQAEQALAKLETEQDDIMSAIEEFDLQLAKYEQDLKDLEERKEKLSEDIATKQEELEIAKAKEEEQYTAMKKRIQYAYESGDTGIFDSIFASSDISDAINKSEYVSQVYKYDSTKFENLVSIKTTIAQYEQELELELKEAEETEEDLLDSKDAVETMRSGKDIQLKNFENSIDKQKALIEQYEKDMAAIEAQIAAAQNIVIPGNYTITLTNGTFQWPVSTGGVVTSEFGPRWGTVHQGMDIGCDTGTPIVAGEDGVVTISQYSPSAGNYVVINHGDGVSTVYMHNSQLNVSVGQQVKRGEIIALAGSTGNSTGPHCHFGVMINGTYVNPRPYLFP